MSLPTFSLSVLRGSEGSLQERDEEWLRAYRHFDPRLRDYFGARDLELDLDELIGDTWGRAFLFIATLREPAAMWSWLTAIGNNIIRDRARASRRRPAASLDHLGDVPALEESFVRAWVAADSDEGLRVQVDEWLAQLSPDDREFLRLVAIDGLSHKEIASQLDLPSAAASRQRLRRLRLRLQESGSNVVEGSSGSPRMEVRE